jgi:hypothetical protein
MSITTEIIPYNINGVLSTKNTVLQNIEALCNAAGCYFTFDVNQGKWAVVINNYTSTYEASFDDSNIIGGIRLSGTGINDLYNKVIVNFPHKDLNDEKDFVTIEVAASERNPNELDNSLNLDYELVNDPVQAQALAFVELKQSRLDKIIEFTTDYTALNLKAGDIIRVTNTPLDFTNKLFRVVSIAEEDADEGQIFLKITGLEYNESVYFLDDIIYYSRQTSTGIISIGNIGKPPTPQVTKFELDSRPRFLIEATVPFGVVDGIEVWYYSLEGDELALWDSALYPDEERTYTFYGTIRSQEDVASGTLTTGQEVTMEIDDLTGGNYLFKVRAANATTVGPYSDSTGIVVYNPQQVTDQIGPNTGAIDANGNAMLGLLGANALLALLKGLMEDGNSEIGGVFRKIFDVFKDVTGVDLVGSNNGGGYRVIYEEDVVITTASTFTALPVSGDLNFTVTATGIYILNGFFNFGSNQTNNTTEQDSARAIKINVREGHVLGQGTIVADTNTSDSGGNVFNDLDCHVILRLEPGNYHLEPSYATQTADIIRATVLVQGPVVGQKVLLPGYA